MKRRYYILSSTFLFVLFIVLSGSCLKKRNRTIKRNNPHNIKGVLSYKRTFGDLSEKHLEAALAIGIEPISSREEAEKKKSGLILIEDNEYYHVDSLTHSIPYLVPQASKLLDKIGENFLDSLSNKGLNPNKITVTSILRTKDDVKKLRQRNQNASEKSAHFYGTTFDISWKRFEKIEDKKEQPMEDVEFETLKLVLSEVLRDLKQENKCFVKYELKQGCFHITAT